MSLRNHPHLGRGQQPKYRTIVADPPWEQRLFSAASGDFYFPSYPTMTVEQIARLPIRRLRQGDAAGNRPDKSVPRDGSFLYLWTTQSFLEAAFTVMRAWGFSPSCILTWCKAPAGLGGGGGTFKSTTEFVVFGRHGSPRANTTIDRQWFTWPRGRHSEKPEAFFDLVEEVSPGPYLELFARRQRLGWDTWGDEALKHVELSA